MERGFCLTMTHESMHLERDWVGELDKQMPRVTCRDLHPARRVSAQREISRVQ